MTAVTTDQNRLKKKPDIVSRPVKAATKIPGGVLVNVGSDGYAKNAEDEASVLESGLVSIEMADNTSGENGDIRVLCERKNQHLFAFSGTASNTDVGKTVYVADNNTVKISTTHSVKAGKITGIESATEVWVDIEEV
mgnify:CR=1 FL=1